MTDQVDHERDASARAATSRRDFLKSGAGAVGAAAVLPGAAVGQALPPLMRS